ncbi:hypothetical protein P8452_73599 [Trifolium repens]|nr:hypothetical protein P8452_73599 [Trifolium repens]
MTFSGCKFYIIFMFLCLSILLVSTQAVEARICKIERNTRLKIYGCNKHICNVDCVEKECASYGVCLPVAIIMTFCYCYYKCPIPSQENPPIPSQKTP